MLLLSLLFGIFNELDFFQMPIVSTPSGSRGIRDGKQHHHFQYCASSPRKQLITVIRGDENRWAEFFAVTIDSRIHQHTPLINRRTDW